MSTAKRAHQTWKRAGKALAPSGKRPAARPETYFADALYMAPPNTILALLHALPDSVASVIVVGHNPGLEELVSALAGEGSDAAALASVRAKFPTAALARLTFDGPWKGLGPGVAALTDVVRVRELD